VDLVPFHFRLPQDEESCLFSCFSILHIPKRHPNHLIRMTLDFPTFPNTGTYLISKQTELRNHLTTPALKRLHHRRHPLRLRPRPLLHNNLHNRLLGRPNLILRPLHLPSTIPPLPLPPHNPHLSRDSGLPHPTNWPLRRPLLRLPNRPALEAGWTGLQFDPDPGVSEEDVWDES
jgi:hypothetical protein